MNESEISFHLPSFCILYMEPSSSSSSIDCRHPNKSFQLEHSFAKTKTVCLNCATVNKEKKLIIKISSKFLNKNLSFFFGFDLAINYRMFDRISHIEVFSFFQIQ